MAKSKVKIQLEAETKEASRHIADLEKHLKSMQEQFKQLEIGSQSFRDYGREIEIVRGKIDMVSRSASMSGERMMSLAASAAAVGASLSAMIEHYKAVIAKSREFEQAQMKYFNPTLVQLEVKKQIRPKKNLSNFNPTLVQLEASLWKL